MQYRSEFTHTALPSRVVFGRGRLAELPDELDRLGIGNVMIVCTPQQRSSARAVAELAGARAHSIYPHAVMHVPVTTAFNAVDYARKHGIDGCVAVGGGSSIGLAKAIALDTDLPTIAVPTTYAGSEMTPIWGLTDANDKKTGRDGRVVPRTVIYDPELTLSLPPKLSATSGFNAMAHAVEALYAVDASPITDLMAGDAVRALASALPRIVEDPADIDARFEALYGAWLSGVCLGSTTMSLHHKLCHIIGGTFDLPHAEVHTIVLPHVAAFNLPSAPRARSILRHALGDDDAAVFLYATAEKMNVAVSLRELGMPEAGIDITVAKALATSFFNPAEVTENGVRHIVTQCFAGVPPTSGL